MKRIVLATSLLLVSAISLATPEAPLAFKKAICGYDENEHSFEDVLRTGAIYRMSDRDEEGKAYYCYYSDQYSAWKNSNDLSFAEVYYYVHADYRPY